ncbi:Aladin [Hondaea fermentalgiana]|uniref:Aladin n=1 Tax=Hondaea fermentalgiana TaxID=2315210 RepID=A0A2R5H1I3_9STRA|nr:Aladin [Hondaea fermentalgiana]|eukprot:GBG34204.1 Aladin [Hondaea fermentalgiana]
MEETLRRALQRRGAPRGARVEAGEGDWALVAAPEEAGLGPRGARDFDSLDEELHKVVHLLSGVPGFAVPGAKATRPEDAGGRQHHGDDNDDDQDRIFIEHVIAALSTAFTAVAKFEQDPNFRKRANITMEDSLGMRSEDVVSGYLARDAACLTRLLYFVALGPAASAVAAILETLAPSLLEQDWVHALLSGRQSADNGKSTQENDGSELAAATAAGEGAPVARHVAWHQEASQVAIILQDESMRVLALENGAWHDHARGAITHEFQHGVSCVAWQPMSSDGIALGCATGVCLWTSELQWMVHLASDGLGVGSLAWSPNGRSLACGSARSGDVVLWDVGSRTHARLQRLRGVTDRLLWSPNGAYLYAGARGLGFRVWEAKSWGCELWSDFAQEVQDAAWSGDGKTLLVATGPSPSAKIAKEDEKASVFAISFVHKPPAIGGDLIPLELDLSSSIGPAASLGLGSDRVRVAGMAWNESSDRLAIRFVDAPAVALYAARWDSQLAFFFLGFVWGPPGAVPCELAFKSSFAPGALLMVNYRCSDGCSAVRLVPLYFDKSRS